MLGIFQNNQKKADRLRRQANRAKARTAAANAKADVFAPPENKGVERATIQRGKEQFEVNLKSPAAAARNQRLKAIEGEQASSSAERESLQEQITELRDQLERRARSGMIIGKTTIGGLRTFLQVMNSKDLPQSPVALAAATALDALADAGDLDDDQEEYTRLLGVLLQAYAYYDSEEGFASVWTSDDPEKAKKEAKKAITKKAKKMAIRLAGDELFERDQEIERLRGEIEKLQKAA